MRSLREAPCKTCTVNRNSRYIFISLLCVVNARCVDEDMPVFGDAEEALSAALSVVPTQVPLAPQSRARAELVPSSDMELLEEVEVPVEKAVVRNKRKRQQLEFRPAHLHKHTPWSVN